MANGLSQIVIEKLKFKNIQVSKLDYEMCLKL